MTTIKFADGWTSDPPIRYDVAVHLAMVAADRHDDVTAMRHLWDAIDAAMRMRDADRLHAARAAFDAAGARYRDDQRNRMITVHT